MQFRRCSVVRFLRTCRSKVTIFIQGFSLYLLIYLLFSMAGLWKSYQKLLEIHPWKTQIATTATLMSLGDFISQTFVERKGKNYSIIRTARFGFFGTVYVGPTLRTWYLIMERLFGVGKKTAFFKLVADQMCFAPVFLATFICGMELLKGNTWNYSKNKVVENFKPVLMSNYQLWPAVQLCNFYFIPFQYRILVVNTTAVGWNTYLAYKTKDTVECNK
ncbi:protein Mpv17 [Octopus bimaculoides]|uniref:Mitochondrial inner membrane protein Mpv17 n=1 Tax=Octopus bimaculoides TaxID=37653 RepID=A0A0L8G9H7_OCTBM|nr:protein Mpv17 [Octopus bimaculoides]|eukprot:XP_014782957.1 PREDICTED: protein Mpv17-like [Octopus bimaculoides]